MNINECCLAYHKLIYLATKYVQSEIYKSSPGEKYPKTVYESEISFEPYSVEITHKFERNTSCHCHPEMETCEKIYKFASFKEWLKKQESFELIYDTVTNSDGVDVDKCLEIETLTQIF